MGLLRTERMYRACVTMRPHPPIVKERRARLGAPKFQCQVGKRD